ncbi:IS5 family transposase [Wolbachia endosymbiont of Cylisticus convexus]|nr:IS5 family transposase [Wolbachia endosymbiont of Cylisticus convexus]
MRSVYPSDISREKFKIILPDLESCRKKTKPRRLMSAPRKAFRRQLVNLGKV